MLTSKFPVNGGSANYFPTTFLGRIVDYLDESGQLDNTVIVFAADHGASAGEHGVDTGRSLPGGGPLPPDDIDNRIENFGRTGSYIDHGRGFAEAATAPFKYQKTTVSEGGQSDVSQVHRKHQQAQRPGTPTNFNPHI